MDNDLETDEEIRNIATLQTFNSVKDGIKHIKTKKNFFIDRFKNNCK